MSSKMGDEGVPDGPTQTGRSRSDATAFAQGAMTRRDAMERLGVRDYAGLLVVLGSFGLVPPRPSSREVEDEAAVFARVWTASGS